MLSENTQTTRETERAPLFALLSAGPGVVARLTGGRKPHPSCLYRWATRGVRGQVLRTCVVGRTLYSREEWLEEFWQAVGTARRRALEPEPPKPRRQRAYPRLERYGLVSEESGR